jgi:hypothetical protein
MRLRSVLFLTFVAATLATPALAGFAGTDVFLPMVGRQAGVHPSNWYTTVWLYNPGADAVTAQLYLLERGTSNLSPPWVDVLVAPGDTEKLENVVEMYFQKQVFGALRVTSPAKLVVTSRVYSKAVGVGESDSVGQDFAGVPASFAIGVGEKSQILGAHQTKPPATSDFRYNFGLVETTGHLANVRVTALDGNGAEMGSTDVTVRAWSQGQWAVKDRFPALSTENSRLEVEVLSGAGRVIAYGSGIANGSQDPTTFEMTYADTLLGIGNVQHDSTLAGDGTASAPLGVADAGIAPQKIAPAATSGQVLTTIGNTVPARGEALAAAGAGAVAWQSLNSVSLGLTPGGVTFGNVAGGLTQDPAGFFYDRENRRLGLGTTTPRDQLELTGLLRLPWTAAVAGSPTAGVLLIGDYAFLHSYGSTSNTFVGPGAGNFSLTGYNNTAVGYASLSDNTTGQGNTAVGADSLARTTEGAGNTAVGSASLYVNTTGTENTALGLGAMQRNTTGFDNTAVGAGSLRNATTATFNSALGHMSLASTTTGAANTAVGDASLYANTTGHDNSALGANSLEKNTTGESNSAIGSWAMHENTDGAFNTAVGARAMYGNTTATGNTAVGAFSLEENATGHSNVAVGLESLRRNGGGCCNVAVGRGSLNVNSSGYGNAALGDESMHANLDGHSNVAVGSGSLPLNTGGSNNIAVGASSLYNNRTGNDNVAIGFDALMNGTAGTGNTAVGSQAGLNATGSGNVFIGGGAGNAETGSNRLYIASGGTAPLIYGQFDARRVGVDTTGPTNTLDVNGSLRARNLAGAGVRSVAVDANGVLMISVPSDERLKKGIVPLGQAIDVLAALAGLRGVVYSWDTAQERASSLGDKRQIGLLAQDVEKVLPEVVSADADGYRAVDYARLTALLVEVAKAQQREIDALEKEVAALRR